jgi:hypothetical protein
VGRRRPRPPLAGHLDQDGQGYRAARGCVAAEKRLVGWVSKAAADQQPVPRRGRRHPGPVVVAVGGLVAGSVAVPGHRAAAGQQSLGLRITEQAGASLRATNPRQLNLRIARMVEQPYAIGQQPRLPPEGQPQADGRAWLRLRSQPPPRTPAWPIAQIGHRCSRASRLR